MSEAVQASRAGIVTVSLRREAARGGTGQRFFELIKALGVRVLPNTAGCRTPRRPSPPRRWRASCSAPTGSSSR